MRKYASKYTKLHANDVLTFGATEPVLTVLEVRGYELRDVFLIGLNDDCGTIVVATESRAENAAAALEPAYKATVKPFRDDWAVDYARRDLDGSEPSRFITDIVLKNGTVVLRDGRWVRRSGGAS